MKINSIKQLLNIDNELLNNGWYIPSNKGITPLTFIRILKEKQEFISNYEVDIKVEYNNNELYLKYIFTNDKESYTITYRYYEL